MEIFNHANIWGTLFIFGFITCLLLLFLVASHVSWIAKSILTLLFLAVIWTAFITFTNSFGYPWRHQLPPNFQILWVEIEEPTKKSDGFIDIWVKEYDEATYKEYRSRLYEIPYSKQNHKRALEAREKLRHGEPVYGKGRGTGNGELSNSDSKGRDAQGNGFNPGAGDYDQDTYGGDYILIEPPKALPPKDGGPLEDEEAVPTAPPPKSGGTPT